jgi:hypothetical protein
MTAHQSEVIPQERPSRPTLRPEPRVQIPDFRQKLTPETVRAFVKMVQGDRHLQAKVLAALGSNGFAAMVEQFFAPTERQKRLLDAHSNSPKEMQQITKDAIRSALTTGGTIDVVHCHSPIEKTSVTVGVGLGPVGINVTVEC